MSSLTSLAASMLAGESVLGVSADRSDMTEISWGGEKGRVASRGREREG